MKVVYTDEALKDLSQILDFIVANYPAIATDFKLRLKSVTKRIGGWPHSAAEVRDRPGVRVVPLVRYPYKVFYKVTAAGVEILHIYHAGRRNLDGEK